MVPQEIVDFIAQLIRTGKPRFQLYHRLYNLPFFSVLDTDYAHIRYRRMLCHRFLDLRGCDSIAGTLDHIVFARDKEDVAVRSHLNGIAHSVPSVNHARFLRLEQLLVVFVRLPVKGARRAFDYHAAHVAGFALPGGCIHYSNLYPWKSSSDGVGYGLRIQSV